MSEENINCEKVENENAIDCTLSDGEKTAKVRAQKNEDGRTVITKAVGDPNSIQRTKKHMKNLGINV